jgi:hypothetical protein
MTLLCSQNKYLGAFARQVTISPWGFPLSLCQGLLLGWFIREGFCHREQYLRETYPGVESMDQAVASSQTTAKLLKSKINDVYLFDYPVYFGTIRFTNNRIAQHLTNDFCV